MLESRPIRVHPVTYFAFGEEERAMFVRHSPRQNHLLAALPSEDYARLLPYLELIPLWLGSHVYGADERENFLYFITEGIVCRFSTMENGTSAEFALTGSEGVVGIAAFLGGDSTSTDTLVVSSGYAYRLRMDRLTKELTHRDPLLHLLLRYIQMLITQAGQMAGCNRHHSLEQRLCLWILSCLDRLSSNELAMTQELIACMLGVRREGVTQAAGSLQKAGLIHYSRGRITLLNRPKLEAQVCECYANMKRECDRLLRSESTIGNAFMHGMHRQ